MSKPTTTKPKNKNTNAPVKADESVAIFIEMLDQIAISGQATRELAESVEAWKVTTLVFTLVSTIALIVALIK